MRIKIKAELVDKELLVNGIKVSIYGLVSFRVEPRGKHLGRYCLDGFKEIAQVNKKYAIVGFVDYEKVVDFYIRAGWYRIGEYMGSVVVSSTPLTNPEFMEKW